MNIEEKYRLLIGFCGEINKFLYNMEDVADFICEYGMEDDIIIHTEHAERFLDTFGIYINRISDMEYREELLKILIPKQLQVESGTYERDSFLKDISSELKEKLEKETTKYLESETYKVDFANSVNKYEDYGLNIPPDDIIKEELIRYFKKQLIKENECEMNEYQSQENNTVPGNEASEMQCEHCESNGITQL